MKKAVAWVDTTSYKRTDTVRTPAVWQTGDYPHQVIVHRWLHQEGWFVTCHPLSVDCVPLTNADSDDAKKEAIKRVSEKLSSMVKEYARIGIKP